MAKRGASGVPAFDRLYEHVPDSVVILAEDGRKILDANPRAAEVMQLDRAELVGRDIADYLSRNLQELTAFAKAVHNHGVVWTDTFSLPTNGNGPKPVDVSASGFEFPWGKFIMLVIHESLAPPDEKARAEKTASEAADYYADRMARFERAVLNRTAHKIRTPLTPILLQLALLEQNLGPLLDDENRQSMESIRRNVSRLSEHVEGVVEAAGLPK